MALAVCKRTSCAKEYWRAKSQQRYCSIACAQVKEQLHSCLHCGSSTSNLKYCSHRCSAIVVNSRQPKRKLRQGASCAFCRKRLYQTARLNKYVQCQCLDAYVGRALREDAPVPPKKRLYDYGLKSPACEWCGLVEWRGEPAPLQLDHINGNTRDNRLDNLRILCPNCHAQTPTFCGKNKKNPDRQVRKKYPQSPVV